MSLLTDLDTPTLETSEAYDPDDALDTASYDVAVVGMSGRFPGAADTEAFWRNLVGGVESIRDFTDEELAAAGISPEVYGRPGYVRRGAVLGDVDRFDAALFGMTPLEAEVTDPQHRLFLECAWEALEDAGYPPLECDLRVGVWGGAFLSTYFFQVLSNPRVVDAAGDLLVRHGNEKDYLTTRTAYRLDLRGPACTVQSACSTSLVAVHHACQSLLGRECDLALAGAAAILVPEVRGYLHEPGGVISRDGRCRPFDAAASGTVFGHGVALVALMRLDEALQAGHEIYAVVKGTAINNDGARKVGFTAPSVDGQAGAVADALVAAGVEPDTLSYVEAHGTGTVLGDPVEVTALTEAFRAAAADGGEGTGRCALGAVKSNVGHLSGVSGVAGLVKTALMLERRMLPPSLHFETPNPRIDFAASPFYVNTRLQPWESEPGRPRRAGVSSFGMGGTNSHAVLEEAPAALPGDPGLPVQLLLLSARSEASLEQRSADLAQALAQRRDLDLADVAFTLHRGRPRLEHRRFLVAEGIEDARRALAEKDPERLPTARQEKKDRPVLFLFPGQGSQYPGMGHGLYESEPLFRAAVDRVAELATPHLGLDLRQLLYPDGVATQEASERLRETRFAQPAIFAVSWAMAELLASWGVAAQAMLGHSIGELVAATLAGVFRLEDAVLVVAERGCLMQSMPAGSMLAVPLAAADLELRLHGGLALAAVNGPASCVVSGRDAAVAALAESLAEEGVESRPLHTSHAFHSPSMDPILKPFARLLEGMRLQAPERPFPSNVTGTWITPEEATEPAYWARQIRSTVRFADGVARLAGEPEAVWLEVGPGRGLSSLAGQHGEAAKRLRLATIRHPKDPDGDRRFLLHTVGRLWQSGAALDGEGFWRGQRRRRLRLPTYPFDRRRYWVEPGDGAAVLYGRPGEEAGTKLEDTFYLPTWRRDRPLPALPPTGRWLLVTDREGHALTDALAARLRAAGRTIFLARAGDRFADGGAELSFDAAAPDGLRPVLEAVEKGGPLGRLVDLRGLEPTENPAGATAEGFNGVLRLARALGRRTAAGETSTSLVVVTACAFDVLGGERVRPESAGRLGPGLSLAQEVPGLVCRVVDLDPEDDLDTLAAALVAEAQSPTSEPAVALRGAVRWQRAFTPVRLGDGESRLARGGRYLLTGGFGGIGCTLARHLAQRYGARLALVGRRPAAQRLDTVRELEKAGAQVLALDGDMGNKDDVERVLDEVSARFGGLDGVFHAAGLAGGGVLQRLGEDEARAVLAPKVDGTLALLDALRCRETAPRFVLLFSSTTALTGGLGRADYAAANAFLDALAAGRPAGETAVMSVNFGTWAEVGMAVRAGAFAPAGDALAALAPELGLQAVEAVLADELPRVVVSPENVEELVAARAAAPADSDEEDGAAGKAEGHERPELANPYVAPNDERERRLAALWASVLGLDEVGVLDNFFELGGTSLAGLQLVRRLRKEMDIEVAAVDLYEGPTIRALGRLLECRTAPPDEDEPSDARQSRGARRRERARRRRPNRGEPA